jgi:thiamine pyrophosphate-dependent acetolactate synthase large subunit-like protein
MVDRAVRIAPAHRTVTAIIFPNDVQEAEAVEVPAHAHGTIHTGVDFTCLQVVPGEQDLKRAADILNSAEKVAILIDSGAAADSLQRLLKVLKGHGDARTVTCDVKVMPAVPSDSVDGRGRSPISGTSADGARKPPSARQVVTVLETVAYRFTNFEKRLVRPSRVSSCSSKARPFSSKI